MGRLHPPLDEGGKQGLGGRELHSGEPARQDLDRSASVRDPSSTSRPSRSATASSDLGRTAQPIGWRTRGHPLATHRPASLLGRTLVDDGDRLEVGVRTGTVRFAVPSPGAGSSVDGHASYRSLRARLATSRSDMAGEPDIVDHGVRNPAVRAGRAVRRGDMRRWERALLGTGRRRSTDRCSAGRTQNDVSPTGSSTRSRCTRINDLGRFLCRCYSSGLSDWAQTAASPGSRAVRLPTSGHCYRGGSRDSAWRPSGREAVSPRTRACTRFVNRRGAGVGHPARGRTFVLYPSLLSAGHPRQRGPDGSEPS